MYRLWLIYAASVAYYAALVLLQVRLIGVWAVLGALAGAAALLYEHKRKPKINAAKAQMVWHKDRRTPLFLAGILLSVGCTRLVMQSAQPVDFVLLAAALQYSIAVLAAQRRQRLQGMPVLALENHSLVVDRYLFAASVRTYDLRHLRAIDFSTWRGTIVLRFDENLVHISPNEFSYETWTDFLQTLIHRQPNVRIGASFGKMKASADAYRLRKQLPISRIEPSLTPNM